MIYPDPVFWEMLFVLGGYLNFYRQMDIRKRKGTDTQRICMFAK